MPGRGFVITTAGPKEPAAGRPQKGQSERASGLPVFAVDRPGSWRRPDASASTGTMPGAAPPRPSSTPTAGSARVPVAVRSLDGRRGRRAPPPSPASSSPCSTSTARMPCSTAVRTRPGLGLRRPPLGLLRPHAAAAGSLRHPTRPHPAPPPAPGRRRPVDGPGRGLRRRLQRRSRSPAGPASSSRPVAGLGEALVQGRARPDRYRLDPRGEIDEVVPGAPGWPASRRGRASRPWATSSVPSPPAADAPQDVEWAFDGRRLPPPPGPAHLLDRRQARLLRAAWSPTWPPASSGRWSGRPSTPPMVTERLRPRLRGDRRAGDGVDYARSRSGSIRGST
ncbi:MAG: hypothetical protein MZU79_07225 [Anaerotruncus sp.]|nr:hypothetical protein [Anaerotruncus sp.]